MEMRFCGLSEKGKRENNEDYYLAEKIKNYYVFAVADGLGGHRAGEVASRVAITELREIIKRKEGSPKELLYKAFEKANSEILQLSRYNPALRGLSTTLVATMVDENKSKITIANLGDSRAYLISKKKIWHTKDHSYVQELIDRGIITEEEAFYHPQKNIVTKALGVEDRVKPDFYEFEMKGFLLLSSDGLHDYVRDEKIKEIVLNNKIERACEALVKEALNSGSEDNITVVLARVEK